MMQFENQKLKDAYLKLEHLDQKIISNQFKLVKPWQGAGVIISKQPSPTSSNTFYPDPRHLVTSYVESASWVFESIRDIFIELDGYGSWKEELFGRLANSANRQNSKNKDLAEIYLLKTLTHEAFAILEEMENYDFYFLPIGVGNEIYNDLIDSIEQEGMISIEDTASFFHRKESAE